MGRDVPRGLAHHIRELTGLWRTDPRTDGELLAAFTAGDGAAFAALVVRHGRSVWATCRHMLGNDADAEDAFQATFIALARKAGEVRPESIDGWLRKVAGEVSLNVRKAVRRKVAAEARLVERATVEVGEGQPDEELRAAVAEEVGLLPERLRVPLTLYYLEGKTQAEVGRVLGVTDRAAAHRVKQALKRVRERLARRGVAVPAAVVIAALENVATAVPTRLAANVAEAALALAAGVPSDTAATRLALEVTRPPAWVRLKLCALVAVPALCAIVGGALPAQRPNAPAPQPVRADLPQPAGARPGDRFGDPLPTGAVARLGTLRFRTGDLGGVPSVGFTAGGKVLVSSHGGSTVHFWDAESGRELRAIDAPASCWAATVAPDGGRMAAVGSGEVWCWDLTGTEPKCVWKVPGKVAGPGTVEFSPDGRLIACGGDSGREVRLLDADKGAVVLTLAGRGCRFVFSADSKTLASWNWSRSAEVCVWDVRDGSLRHTLTAGGENDVVSSVTFSPDGKALATVGGDRRLRVWDAGTGAERPALAADADPQAFVAYSPDGKALIEIGGGRVRRWDLATGRAGAAVPCPGGGWAAGRLSADGTRLATAAPFGVALWDVKSGRELGAAAGMPDGFVHPVAFSPDGKVVATASFSEATGGAVQVWDAADGRLRRRLTVPPRQFVWAMDFGAGGALSAPLGALVDLPPKPPTRVARWDAGTGAPRPDLSLPDGARGVAFAPNGKSLAIASAEAVRLCDRETGREEKKLAARCDADALAFSADGAALAALDATAGFVIVWSQKDGRERRWPTVDKPALALRPPVALSPDGRLLAVGSGAPGAGIRVVDVASGAELAPLDGQPHGWAFQEFAFAPDGLTLASAGADGVVRVWELASGRERYRFAGHRSAALGVAFSPDGRRLASSSADSTALVWDVYEPQRPAPAARATPARLWAALSGADAAAAHRAIAALAAAPDTAVPLLKEKLCPPAPSAEQVRRWLDDLGADQFAVREAATEELARRGDLLGAELRAALATTTSPEARTRLRQLVSALGPQSGGNRTVVRGVEALERMGHNPAARRVLEELAKFPAESAAGREARHACRRLKDAAPGEK